MRLGRAVLVATALVAGTGVAFTGGGGDPAAASGGKPSVPAAGTPVGPPGLTLLSQTPWITQRGMFHIRLRVTANDPTHDRLAVQAFTSVSSRSAFDSAAAGDVGGVVWYSPAPVPIATLQPDAAGDYELQIPVNFTAPTDPTGATLSTFDATQDGGVYPLQVGVYTPDGVLEGQPLTIFLVYAVASSPEAGLTRLSVAFVLPVHAPPSVTSKGAVGPVATGDEKRLAVVAAVLASRSGVAVSLDATPQTLAALDASTGDTTAKGAISNLAGAVGAGAFQVLASPYVRVALGDLSDSGLGTEIPKQLSTGADVLQRILGRAPDNTTWVVDGPLDQSTLSDMVAAGARNVIVPDADLSPLPNALTQLTFAQPTVLTNPTGPNLTVYAADAGLTGDFTASPDPVLAANRILAELAEIQREQPGLPRGLVVMPPSGWVADPNFVSTLLTGLSGNPLLDAVTSSALFAKVHCAGVDATPLSCANGGLARQLQFPPASPVTPSPASSLPSTGATPTSPALPALTVSNVAADAGQIRAARQMVGAITSILPPGTIETAALPLQILTSESSDLTEPQRQALLQSVSKAADDVTRQISLPGSSNITLTSNKGQIPLTILAAPSLHARVELQLSSQRLFFQSFTSPNGPCRVPTPTTEICDLTLTSENTTLKVPVQTRSTGVSPLDVAVWSPDGSLRLAYEQETVSSTAISGVGLVLIIVTIVSLAIWWVRDLRHGRRARRLVPAPTDDELDALGDDPVIIDFFAKPPPEYDRPGPGA